MVILSRIWVLTHSERLWSFIKSDLLFVFHTFLHPHQNTAQLWCMVVWGTEPRALEALA